MTETEFQKLIYELRAILAQSKPKRASAILVDGSNIHASSRALSFHLDYRKMVDFFDQETDVQYLYYFTAIRAQQEYDNLRPMLDFLEYNGWSVITKPTKEWTDPETGRLNIKGNMDIEICQVANELSDRIKDLILFTGDGDFRFMVESLQRFKGISVSVVSTIQSDPPMCADELRRQANEFIDLQNIRQIIERTPDEKKKFFTR